LERTEQVKDILGLMGDAVDNIPGIPGIGEKTAMKLVQQFGSLEGVIDNADQLKGKQQENVIAFAEQGRLSKQLATIIIDAPVELDHEALHLDAPDQGKVLEVFSELEFKNLTGRVLGVDAPADEKVASGNRQPNSRSSGSFRHFRGRGWPCGTQGDGHHRDGEASLLPGGRERGCTCLRRS
jgi:DNA polymerase-1